MRLEKLISTGKSVPFFPKVVLPVMAWTTQSDLRLDFAEFAYKGGEVGAVGNRSGKPGKRAYASGHRSWRRSDALKGMLLSYDQISSQAMDKGGQPVMPSIGAYEKPVRPEVPFAQNQSFVRNPIDSFVLQISKTRLDPERTCGQSPLAGKSKPRAYRIPPTVREMMPFIDDSPNAREKVVERLLASPRYGEHWARQWLDLARYADSNGFQADQLRDSWAFRDWVIEAMNADMPFDRFSIEQLAGDLLPESTVSQKIATGFHRTPTCNVEAGVHPEENRVNQVFDRVNATGLTWLGTTLECAQCHSHKYDPFSQEEYFKLFAFFNNTPLEVRNKSGRAFPLTFGGRRWTAVGC